MKRPSLRQIAAPVSSPIMYPTISPALYQEQIVAPGALESAVAMDVLPALEWLGIFLALAVLLRRRLVAW